MKAGAVEGALAQPVAPHLPCLQPWGGAQDHVCSPREDQCCAPQPGAGQQWGSCPPLCPSTLQRDGPRLLLVWVGVGSRAGGNSSDQDLGMLQLFPDSQQLACALHTRKGQWGGSPGSPMSLPADSLRAMAVPLG